MPLRHVYSINAIFLSAVRAVHALETTRYRYKSRPKAAQRNKCTYEVIQAYLICKRFLLNQICCGFMNFYCQMGRFLFLLMPDLRCEPFIFVLLMFIIIFVTTRQLPNARKTFCRFDDAPNQKPNTKCRQNA